jgi:hypothetical protein
MKTRRRIVAGPDALRAVGGNCRDRWHGALPARARAAMPTQQDLVKIPEIATDGQGHLRGTIS